MIKKCVKYKKKNVLMSKIILHSNATTTTNTTTATFTNSNNLYNQLKRKTLTEGLFTRIMAHLNSFKTQTTVAALRSNSTA